MFTTVNVTGAVVLEVRTRHKLSRERFSRLAGLPGKSTARLYNIENKDSWRDGDREAVVRVLNELEGGRFDPRYHETPTLPTRPDRGDLVTGLLDPDDDPADLIVEVGGVALPVTSATSTLTVVPLHDAEETAVADDGVYRVSNGELQSWKRCRRKWWLAWYRGLALRHEDLLTVRATGDRVHRALRRWYVPEGQPRVDPRDALERVIVEDWTRVTEVARERQLSEEQLGALAVEFAATTNLERAMVEGYVQWLEETGADAELRVTASETPLRADLEVDVAGVTREVAFIGLLDVRVHRVTDDVRLFLDHKTVGDLSSPAVTLPQDEQMLQYDLLEFLATPDADARCDGALYNMLKRVKRTARAKPPFYSRVEVRHNRYELESYKRRALAATRDVLLAVDALDRGVDHRDVVYPSPRAACSWDCDFFAVCNMLDDGSPGADDMLRTLYHEVDPRDRYDRTSERTSVT